MEVYRTVRVHYEGKKATKQESAKMIKEKEIAKLLDEGRVVVIGEEKGIVMVNIIGKENW